MHRETVLTEGHPMRVVAVLVLALLADCSPVDNVAACLRYTDARLVAGCPVERWYREEVCREQMAEEPCDWTETWECLTEAVDCSREDRGDSSHCLVPESCTGCVRLRDGRLLCG